MLTVKQAAARLGVSRSLVYAWVASGALAHYRLGATGRGNIAIEDDDLNAMLATMRRGKRAMPPLPPPPVKLHHLRLRPSAASP